MQVRLTINGQTHELDVAPHRSLAEVLRADLALTGTKVACGEGTCGTCTVLLDGRAVKSCTVLAVQADGARVTTIEGLAEDGQLHPVQRAFHEQHGLQCGFCTPGLILTTVDLLGRDPDPSEEEIRRAIKGNLCRCTGYQNIVRAIDAAATELRGDAQKTEVRR